MSFEPRFTTTDAMTAALSRIERARGFLDATRLSEEWIESMQSKALTREVHHSTHIEGTRLSFEDSETLLAGGDVPGSDPEDVRELLNYREAFEMVAGHLDHQAPVTENLIREIHRRLVEGVRGSSAEPGKYREVQNYVVNSATREVIYTPPEAFEVPILMAELVEWLASAQGVHPILQAGIAQFQLVHIHPFLDGNGRTARLLSTLCLYGSGYDFKRLFSISEFYDADRPAYYQAIQSVRRNKMDMTSWLEYFTDGLAEQMQEVRDLGERVIRRDLLEKEIGVSPRQALALEIVKNGETLTMKVFERLCPSISRRTLQRDLKALVDAGFLRSKGETNRLQYVAGKKLS
jgi:Fic family protein